MYQSRYYLRNLIIRIIFLLGVIYLSAGKPPKDKQKANDKKGKDDKNWTDEKAFMVKIKAKSSYLCDGTIISDRWVVTAANCLFVDDLPVSFNGVMVETQVKSYKVTKRNIHVEYQFAGICDIVVLRVQGKIAFGKKVKKVVLEKSNEKSDLNYDKCKVLSLKTKEKSVDMHLISNDDCKQEWLGYATYRNICGKAATKKPISCTAYTGAPLMCSGKQVGLLSFGPQHCQGGGIDVFTKIPDFIEWIKENTSEAKKSTK